jgi:hypothetical protein
VSASLYRTLEDLRWNKSDLTENALLFNYSGRLGQRPIFSHAQFNMVWRSFMPQHDAPFPIREHAGLLIWAGVEKGADPMPYFFGGGGNYSPKIFKVEKKS